MQALHLIFICNVGVASNFDLHMQVWHLFFVHNAGPINRFEGGFHGHRMQSKELISVTRLKNSNAQ